MIGHHWFHPLILTFEENFYLRCILLLFRGNLRTSTISATRTIEPSSKANFTFNPESADGSSVKVVAELSEMLELAVVCDEPPLLSVGLFVDEVTEEEGLELLAVVLGWGEYETV